MREERFERVYGEHVEGLLRFLAFRSGDRALAEDLAAETFEKVLRERRRFDPRRGSEKAWIYAIAVNLLRDHARRRAAEQRSLERVGPGSTWHVDDAAFDRVEARGDLYRALDTLTDDERELVTLRFGAGLTVPEMAEAVGGSHRAVEGRFYRALRKLRDLMD